MTALTRYQRLECLGIWREKPEAQRRDVVVSLGDASLVISDGRNDTALTHWSLPAVSRINPGHLPALYSPAPDAPELLELDDATMIAALGQVHLVIASGRQRPGRLRQALLIGGLGLVLGLGMFWMPDALVNHTAKVVPPSKQAEIGRLILTDLLPLTGAPCNQPEGLAALQTLRDRILGPRNGELVVLPMGISSTARVPGRVVLISDTLLATQDNPDILAGYVAAEALRAEISDPMVVLLQDLGLRATFTLLTTGDLPPGALRGYGDRLIADGTRAVADEALIERFTQLGIPTTPYARAIDPGGESTRALIAADPFGSTPPPLPVLADGDWVTLQGICSI